MQIKPITYNLAVDEPAGLFVLSCQRILIEIKISYERKVLPFQTVPFFNLQNDKIWHKNRAFTVNFTFFHLARNHPLCYNILVRRLLHIHKPL